MQKAALSIAACYLAISVAASAQPNTDFSVSGQIGPHSGPTHDVVVSVLGEQATIEYPELGCTGQLTPTYTSPGGLFTQLEADGAIEFHEIVSGSDCPTGGFMMIAADGNGGWLLERQGGTTGARSWSGPVEISLGSVDTAVVAEITDIPPGTVAGDPELGLFLANGPIERGIGPTSVVTGVQEDSIPAIFGIQQGDIILHVDKGAAEPAGHIQMLLTGLGRDGAVDVAVRSGTTGEDRIIGLYAPDESVEAQFRAAARDDILGPSLDPISFRLRLFADGAFEALEFLAQADWDSYTTYGGVRWERILTPGSERGRYDHLVAAYGAARLGFLGRCGEPVVSLIARGGALTEHRVGSTTVRTTDTRYEQPFEALQSFAPVIQATNYLRQRGVNGPGWRAVRMDFEPVFKQLECDSEERRRLEENLLSYAR